MCRPFFFIAVLFLLDLLLCGCKSADVSMVSTREFSLSQPRTGSAEVAKLASGDTIEMSVEVDGRKEVPLSQVTVNQLGFVTLPLVGDVYVAGLGLNQARETITRRYETYYITKPVVMISLASEDGSSEWGHVLITGRGIENPGPIPLSSSSGLRLSAAIKAAGGFSASANTSKIQVTRVDARGRKLQVMVDFDDIGAGGKAEQDIQLVAGDIVNIPERIW